jgi:acetoin utilization deacetylase AcuC-like enzyme
LSELIFYYPPGHEVHYSPNHPERPERIDAVVKGLKDKGWWDLIPKVDPITIPDPVLYNIHDPGYLSVLNQACHRGDWLDGDTYTTPGSWSLAHKTAGGTAAVAEAVWLGKGLRGFAITRPPGHHASRAAGSGFCLLNNIALAVEYLIQSKQAQRLAILDLDLHHGNGTQDIFYRRNDVLFISLHQYPLYPFSGRLDEQGEGPGLGYTCNFPMAPRSGDEAYLNVVHELVLPILEAFAPEMILISYGFDAHWLDPLGGLNLSANCFYQVMRMVSAWVDIYCQGKMMLVLEGGYALQAAEACTQAVIAGVLGECWEDPLGTSPNPNSDYWKVNFNKAKQIWHI